MTDVDSVDSFDRDDELRALLHAADPARVLPPLEASGVASLVGEAATPSAGRAQGPRRRGPATWLAGAAAAAIVLTAGVGAVHRVVGDDQPATAGHRATAQSGPSAATTSSPSPAVTTTPAPATATLSLASGALDARCAAAPDAGMLAQNDTAFAGTVRSIHRGRVTLRAQATYHGAVAHTVTVTAAARDFGRLVDTVHFVVGHRYLISGYQGQLTVCGFSGPATPALQQLYAKAFPR